MTNKLLRRRVDKNRWPGVYCYESASRTFQGKIDVCYYITYKVYEKKRWEKVGWKSEGYSPQVAAEIRGDRVKAARHGKEVKTAKEIRKENESKDQTIGAIGKIYFDTKGSMLRGFVTDKNRYDKHIEPRFAKKHIGDITTLDIEELKKSMEKYKPATIWNTLELLRRIINFGHKANLCGTLPFVIEMPKRDNEVVEYLTPEETERFLKTIRAWPAKDVSNMLLLAFFTGMRRGEIFKLEDRDIDFEMKIIRIRDPKGGKSSSIGLNSLAENVLLGQIQWRNKQYPDSPYLFPGREGAQRVDCSAVDRVKKEAELPISFRPFHGLRHHYAVMLANSGQFTLDMIGELLTHKSPTMTKRYGQFLPETMRRASETAGKILISREGS